MMEEADKLDSAFLKQYLDVFSKELPFKLPPEGGPMHGIILKDDESINGKLMRVPQSIACHETIH